MIQVQCAECQQSLMASEEQAGTMIPCRYCGAWVRIPGTAPGGVENTEAPCPFCGHSILIEAGDIGIPISCPHCKQMIEVARHPATGQLVLQPGESAVPGEPIPWENRAELGLVHALWHTFKEVAFAPTQFFRRMRPYGLGEVLLYLAVIGVLVVIFGFIPQTLLRLNLDNYIFSLVQRPGAPVQPRPSFPATFGLLGCAIMVLFMPLACIIGMFISAAFSHLVLMVVGGANKGYENTCRVFSYSYSTQLFNIIPFCGSLVAGIWFIVVATVGLRETNRIGTGRALIAVLGPTIFILSCACACVITAFGLFAASGSM